MDFLILNKDIVVAKWIDKSLIIENAALLPLYFKYGNDAEKWLETRAIDSHRANSRLLKKALRLTEKDDIDSVLAVNGATITDNYWIKPMGSNLSYSEVRFDDDYFSNLALNGNYDSFNKVSNSKNSKTPELTNIGSYEKCWKLVDNVWWMYKKANHEELFSELFIFELGTVLGFKMAQYKRGKGVIKTKDFTDNANVNFEPFYNILKDSEDYIETVEVLKKICPEAIGDYVKMLFLDTVCANPDRHTFNYGLLRDSDTGKILGLAPNFDNNMALISRGYPKNIKRKNDILVTLFNELLEYDNSLKRFIPGLNEEIVAGAIKKVGMKVKSKVITEFIMNGYNQINK